MTNAAGRPAQENEGDKDAHGDIQEDQPQQAHAEHSRHAAKPDDGRGANESRTVGQRHDEGMNLTAGQQVVGRGFGLFPPHKPQISHDQQINHDQDGFHHSHCLWRSFTHVGFETPIGGYRIVMRRNLQVCFSPHNARSFSKFYWEKEGPARAPVPQNVAQVEPVAGPPPSAVFVRL